jgi:hypothetical protein
VNIPRNNRKFIIATDLTVSIKGIGKKPKKETAIPTLFPLLNAGPISNESRKWLANFT